MSQRLSALLDNPVYGSLSGPHAAIAEVRGRALRYPADVAPFLALPSDPTDRDWQDAIGLLPPGASVATLRAATRVAESWSVINTRGQGIATRLLRAVAAGIERRSERAFLHTGTSNTTAINLYETLGFRARRRLTIAVISHQQVSGSGI